MHMNFFNGAVQIGESDWGHEQWDGYETAALNRYAFEFMESAGEEGIRRDTLTAPVDLFPTLCSLCNVPVPALVEGHDLSASWCGRQGAL
jgi:arylsulfatase A-like enzyme